MTPSTHGLPGIVAIATRNRHKMGEILSICADWPVEWVTGPGRSEWPDVEETGETYLENALLKARAVATVTGLPALADDSGIEADALHGGPGVRSARFAGEHATDLQNLDLLIQRIRQVPAERRTGRYRCIAALARPDGTVDWAEGVSEGRILIDPRGTGGFGYDPAFVPEEEDRTGSARTMAELSADEKHAISHRGRAFRALRSRLEGRSAPPGQAD